MMSSLEEQFQKACDAGDIPGVVLVASDAKGTPAFSSFSSSFGSIPAEDKPVWESFTDKAQAPSPINGPLDPRTPIMKRSI